MTAVARYRQRFRSRQAPWWANQPFCTDCHKYAWPNEATAWRVLPKMPADSEGNRPTAAYQCPRRRNWWHVTAAPQY